MKSEVDRHFGFKGDHFLAEAVLASEEEPVQVFDILRYVPNLKVFIVIY